MVRVVNYRTVPVINIGPLSASLKYQNGQNRGASDLEDTLEINNVLPLKFSQMVSSYSTPFLQQC